MKSQTLESKPVVINRTYLPPPLINFVRVATWYSRTFSGYLSLVVFIGSIALGRPPIETEDTGTPGDGKWEINTAWTYTRSSSAKNSTLPILDVNYGIGSSIQLKYEIAGLERRVLGGDVQRAISDSLAGIKWRVRDQEDFPISVFPQVQFQTPGSKARQKALTEDGIKISIPWETTRVIGQTSIDLEIGPVFYTNDDPHWIYGLALTRPFGQQLELAIEFRSEARASFTHRIPAVNAAAHIKVMPNGGLLVSIGRQIHNPDSVCTTLTAYVGWQILR
jgi:hypothetical protein